MTTTVPPKTVASIRWLAAPTSWSWVEQANARPMEVLIDHAHRNASSWRRGANDVPLPV